MLRWLSRTALCIVVVATVGVFASRLVGGVVGAKQIAAYTASLTKPYTTQHWQLFFTAVDRGVTARVHVPRDDDSMGFPFSWSPDGDELAYVNGDDIYVLSMADLQAHNITASAGYRNATPTWSPDGRQLVFFAARGENENKQNFIGLVDVETEQAAYLFLGSDSDYGTLLPSWNADNQTIVFGTNIKGTLEDQLLVMGIDHHNLLPLFAHVGDSPRYPRWSPDGRWLAYQAGKTVMEESDFGTTYPRLYKQLWLVDSETYASGLIADAYEGIAAWSPNSREIAYTIWEGEPNHIYQVLMVRDIFTGEVRRLSQPSINNMMPVWSPDGSQFAVVTDEGAVRSLQLVDAQTGTRRQITLIDGVPSQPPAWSPDGRWVTVFVDDYVSNSTAFPTTYVVNVVDSSIPPQIDRYHMGFAWRPGD